MSLLPADDAPLVDPPSAAALAEAAADAALLLAAADVRNSFLRTMQSVHVSAPFAQILISGYLCFQKLRNLVHETTRLYSEPGGHKDKPSSSKGL